MLMDIRLRLEMVEKFRVEMSFCSPHMLPISHKFIFCQRHAIMSMLVLLCFVEYHNHVFCEKIYQCFQKQASNVFEVSIKGLKQLNLGLCISFRQKI